MSPSAPLCNQKNPIFALTPLSNFFLNPPAEQLVIILYTSKTEISDKVFSFRWFLQASHGLCDLVGAPTGVENGKILIEAEKRATPSIMQLFLVKPQRVAELDFICGHPSNKDTFTGPKGGRVKGVPYCTL